MHPPPNKQEHNEKEDLMMTWKCHRTSGGSPCCLRLVHEQSARFFVALDTEGAQFDDISGPWAWALASLHNDHSSGGDLCFLSPVPSKDQNLEGEVLMLGSIVVSSCQLPDFARKLQLGVITGDPLRVMPPTLYASY